ncbi:hypothetical protein SBA6_80002 [Candidatus Sulfopaludibacter sp. SbA6]|nr:hypothetical protein SBA6_80002 [Candidatus Sulfopaludibacter sp. SbA6]
MRSRRISSAGWRIRRRSTAVQSMRRPEEVLRDLVRQWITKADRDYLAAEQLRSRVPNACHEISAPTAP